MKFFKLLVILLIIFSLSTVNAEGQVGGDGDVVIDGKDIPVPHSIEDKKDF